MCILHLGYVPVLQRVRFLAQGFALPFTALHLLDTIPSVNIDQEP